MKNPFEIWQKNLLSHPDQTACGDECGVLTGQEVLTLVDRLCVLIESRLQGRKDSVGIGIFLPRDNTYLAAMFAAWRMGHYFIPLNTRWPREHLMKIVKKADPAVVLTLENIDGIPSLSIKDLAQQPAVSETLNRQWAKRRSQARLAYIIFTSGSTGEQKGVMISLPAFMAYVDWAKKYFQAHRNNKALLITAELTFDITLGDIAFALAHDVEVHLSPDPRNLIWHAKLIQDRQIDTFYSVPSTIRHLFSWIQGRHDVSFQHLKLVVSGGDAFPWELVDLVKSTAPQAEFYNVYGPTEVTINCVATRVDDLKNIRQKRLPVPIGLPFLHLQTMLQPEHPGDPKTGELLVAGLQCMDGYVGDPELTAKAFTTIEGQRYYRTGDLVTQDEQGYYYVQGRMDNLVKVKGYRINPTEIDNALADTLGLKEVKTVIFREDESDKQIVSFFVPVVQGKDISLELENHCRQKLPSYMVPQVFVLLGSLPMGSSGKYDVQMLRAKYLEMLKVNH